MKFLQVVILAQFGFICQVFAHVALTFPPARKYDLDFLDVFRTKKPCGMSKGELKTTIVNGKELSIQWHLGYPHRGGFRLELLDQNEKLLRYLTPQDAFVGDEDTQMQSYKVQLDDNLKCVGCTIRLVRQALEWGKSYLFQSCADVDIVGPEDYKNDCSNHGSLSATGSCRCDRTYFGKLCEFKNDCQDDSDCNNRGRCIDIGATTLPAKQCFCQFGYFGQNCQKISTIKDRNFTPSNYEKVSSSDKKFTFYWRILPNSIMEGIFVALTKTWAGVGWRPKNLGKGCQRYPEDALAPIGKDFHSMDCTDIIIGSVRDGSYSRVEDYYTRDRSTPRLDSYFGGKSDLIGALGFEENGVTTIMFQRPVRTPKASGFNFDHDFNGMLKVIWATGRTDLHFYTEDELKYHGRNRGKFDIVVNSSKTLRSSFLILAASFLVARL